MASNDALAGSQIACMKVALVFRHFAFPAISFFLGGRGSRAACSSATTTHGRRYYSLCNLSLPHYSCCHIALHHSLSIDPVTIVGSYLPALVPPTTRPHCHQNSARRSIVSQRRISSYLLQRQTPRPYTPSLRHLRQRIGE
jgi:hypothetical protein